MRLSSLRDLVICAAVLCTTATSFATEQPTVAETFDIPSEAPGLALHIEHRGPPFATKRTARQAVLLVHGNFFPASSSFGVDLPGGSALARLAEAGLSVYTLDLRGYGGSTRPPFMSEPIGPYVAFATTEQAQADVGSALAFIRKREGLSRVSLVGWSWGAAIVGEFATRRPAQVDKLVLYGPAWLSIEALPAQPPSGSYRTLNRAASRARVLNGVPADRIEELHPSDWFERWWSLNLRLDDEGSRRSPPVVRAPSGVTQALTDFWSQGKPAWDPTKVRAKTLVIVGEWDRNTPPAGAKAVHARLTHAASRELTILPEATHFALLEKNRVALLDALSRFLTKR